MINSAYVCIFNINERDNRNTWVEYDKHTEYRSDANSVTWIFFSKSVSISMITFSWELHTIWIPLFYGVIIWLLLLWPFLPHCYIHVHVVPLSCHFQCRAFVDKMLNLKKKVKKNKNKKLSLEYRSQRIMAPWGQIWCQPAHADVQNIYNIMLELSCVGCVGIYTRMPMQIHFLKSTVTNCFNPVFIFIVVHILMCMYNI